MNPRFRSVLLFALDVFLNAVVIIVLVVIIRVFILSPFQVHGPSMCDTLNNFDGNCLRNSGEYIMVYKFGYQEILGWQIGLPERGDVVVFQPPDADEGEYLIKRVIGIPGDTVEIRDGYVYVSNDEWEDEKLDESLYLNALNWGNTQPHRNSPASFDVSEGEYFLMGDNRKESSDARQCFDSFGCDEENTAFVTLDEIQGRAWLVLWPFDHMRTIDRMDY